MLSASAFAEHTVPYHRRFPSRLTHHKRFPCWFYLTKTLWPAADVFTSVHSYPAQYCCFTTHAWVLIGLLARALQLIFGSRWSLIKIVHLLSDVWISVVDLRYVTDNIFAHIKSLHILKLIFLLVYFSAMIHLQVNFNFLCSKKISMMSSFSPVFDIC